MTQDDALRILSYDRVSGEFRWRINASPRVLAGSVAGTVNDKGYLVIRYKGKVYKAHRLAWLIITSSLPSGEIDHVNGNKLDNSISNLRIASREQNNRNVGLRSDNTSGFKGVRWSNPNKKWHANISVAKKRIHLGFFEKKEDAVEAYRKASLKYHKNFSPFNSGVFPR